MPVIGLRRLSRETRDVVKEMEDTGEPVIVARRGEPVAVLLPATPERLADAAVAISPEFRAGFEEADAEFAAGKTRPLDEVIAELDGEVSVEGENDEEATEGEVGIAPATVKELVSTVGQGAVGSVAPPVPSGFREQSKILNTKLVEDLVESGVQDALLRAQTVNKTLVSLAGGPDHLSISAYLKMLRRVIATEHVTGDVNLFHVTPASWTTSMEAAEAPEEVAAEAEAEAEQGEIA